MKTLANINRAAEVALFCCLVSPLICVIWGLGYVAVVLHFLTGVLAIVIGALFNVVEVAAERLLPGDCADGMRP